MSFPLERQKQLSVSILVLPQSSMMTVASVLEPLRAANRVSGQDLFNWTLMGLDTDPVPLTCGVPLSVAKGFDGRCKGDLLVIIGGFNQQQHVKANTLSIIRNVVSGFGVVAGVEAGSWVLARTGLLNGHSSTTHWEDFEEFAEAFPEVNVKMDRYVMDGKYMTCGGASPAFDMMLHIIRLLHGSSLALEVASVFIYDQARDHTDAQPLISLGRLTGNETRLTNAIRLMEDRIEQPLPVEAIAKRVGVSSKTLETIFSRTLEISPGRFYLNLRLKAAFRMITNSDASIREISVRSGFGSLSAFSRAYSKYFGVSPIQSRKAAREN